VTHSLSWLYKSYLKKNGAILGFASSRLLGGSIWVVTFGRWIFHRQFFSIPSENTELIDAMGFLFIANEFFSE
jgi:hypothetical protein